MSKEKGGREKSLPSAEDKKRRRGRVEARDTFKRLIRGKQVLLVIKIII
jgi:hypothetical protein